MIVYFLLVELDLVGKVYWSGFQGVTKERSIKLLSQQRDTTLLAQQILHVLNFSHWAIHNGSSTALLYSKRLVSTTRYECENTLDPMTSNYNT